MPRTLAALAALVFAFGLAASAAAQEERIWRPPGGANAEGEISLYRAPNFEGGSVRIETAVANLGLDWRVRSIRITRGSWQVCTGANYTGGCSTLQQSVNMIPIVSPLAQIRSIRPIVQGPPPGGGGDGPSLRGMAAAFYTQPSVRGQRIPACERGHATANCARATAQQFCRARGYNYVGNSALETVRGRVYLADVLCKRSAT